jgi:hypothetical protein
VDPDITRALGEARFSLTARIQVARLPTFPVDHRHRHQLTDLVSRVRHIPEEGAVHDILLVDSLCSPTTSTAIPVHELVYPRFGPKVAGQA